MAFQVTTFPGDFDSDEEVDQEDFGHLQACMSGAGIPMDTPACINADLDRDGDVDPDDFGRFQSCFSGAEVSPDRSCMN